MFQKIGRSFFEIINVGKKVNNKDVSKNWADNFKFENYFEKIKLDYGNSQITLLK